MAFSASNISSAYVTLFTAITTELDKLWTAKKIDAETYATLLGQATSNLMVQVGDLMQKQQQVDADTELKEAQIAEIDAKISLINEQRESEAMNNMDDGVVANQILDIKAATALKTSQKGVEDDKKETAEANRAVLFAQEELYKRQKDGFDDNKKQKVLETAMNGLSMIYSDATTTPPIPTTISSTTAIDSLFTSAFGSAIT